MSLRSLMAKANKIKADKVPAGWHTSEWYARRDNLSLRRAQVLLKDLKSEGMVETKSYRILDSAGRLVRLTHYKTK